MSTAEQSISIILIVKNDKGVLRTVKELLHLIEHKKVEIIVVDSSTQLIENPYKDNLVIQWIKFENKSTKKITIPEQRNVGVKKATGEIIVFIDANCNPHKDWLQEITKPIIAEGEDIVAGSIWSATENKYHDRKNELIGNKDYLDEAATMNLAVKRNVFEKIGYFDESFDYGSDVDFTRRAVERGYKIKYHPAAKLTHNWGSFRDEIKRAFRYGEARVNIYKKHRINLISLIKTDPITVFYPVFIFFLPVSLIFPVYLVLLIVPIIKNYKHSPLRTTVLNFVYGMGILNKLIINK